MFGNGLRQAQTGFEAQFEPDGTGFIYRKSSTGIPYRISADERDAFVSVFIRRVRVGTWVLVGGTILLIIALALLVGDPDAPGSGVVKYAAFLGLFSAYVVAFMWIWGEPARALQRRSAIGNALTRSEARSHAFSKITYPNIGLGLILGLVVILTHIDEMEGWGILWMVGGGALILQGIIQAVRKWMHERSGSPT